MKLLSGKISGVFRRHIKGAVGPHISSGNSPDSAHAVSQLYKQMAVAYRIVVLLCTGVVLCQTACAAATDSLAAAFDCYQLGPSDVIAVSVAGHSDLTLQEEIDPDGAIRYPLLGTFKIAGLCREACAQLLKQKLEKDYLYSADVTVDIISRRSKSVLVLGQVAKPGKQVLTQQTSLIDVIYAAGGVNSHSIKKIVVMRTIDAPATASAARSGRSGKSVTAYQVDCRQLFEQADMRMNLKMQDGDIVNVVGLNESEYWIMGEVHTPGVYKYSENLSLEKALTLAGGCTNFAWQSMIYVKRIVNGTEIKARLKMGDVIKEGDVIFVPERLF
jgi:polysaccharide biosynthesis/export protein